MLNLTPYFEDANRAYANHAEQITIAPLPAAVFMVQMDVINRYRHGLNHYLNLTLNESYLQNSTCTPYQKWAAVNNDNFEMLTFEIHNLLRYTRRLMEDTEIAFLRENWRFNEHNRKCNAYNPIHAIRVDKKRHGITIHQDNTLTISAIDRYPQVTAEFQDTDDGQRSFYRYYIDAEDCEHREPIDLAEFERLRAEYVFEEKIDIGDRSILAAIRERGHIEVRELEFQNNLFREHCNEFYKTRNVADLYSSMNASYWI